MNSQEKLAREWAINFSEDAAALTHEQLRAAIKFILDNTKSETMSDVMWDSRKHFLAGAINHAGDEVVMAGLIDGEKIDVIVPDENLRYREYRSNLVPNGKRYKLVEDTIPNHPEELETIRDYENAPVGTVVAYNLGRGVDLKCDENVWEYTGFDGNNSDVDMCGTTRRVLRWGWSDEA